MAERSDELDGETVVHVRRHWSDYRIGSVRLKDLSGFHWSRTGGGEIRGLGSVAPRPFLHARMWCDRLVDGEISHSCRHGPPPHQVIVCIVKKDNQRQTYEAVKALAP